MHRRRSALVLTDEEVRYIRKQAKAGHTVRHIAAELGVGHAQVHRIITRQSRKGVK